MLTFKEFLLEDKSGKNLHLEHLEDEIINFGVGGARGAINFLQELHISTRKPAFHVHGSLIIQMIKR